MLQASPIYAIIIGVEIVISNYHNRKVYNLREVLVTCYFSIMNAGLDLLVRGLYLVVLQSCFQIRFISIDHSLLNWSGLLVFIDFQFYWLHRLEHFCRFFWAVHVTHHSSESLNTTVGFWSLFVHTELIGKLGWMEQVFVTPSHHRVHHASNLKYLDKNMGLVLIIWDRLFGTFQRELSEKEYEPIKYGLTRPIKDYSPFNVLFHEWIDILKDTTRKDISWKHRIHYLFGRPGWNHHQGK